MKKKNDLHVGFFSFAPQANEKNQQSIFIHIHAFSWTAIGHIHIKQNKNLWHYLLRQRKRSL